LFEITGLLSIKTGLRTFGTSGKFSVIGGGCFLSNQNLPAKIGPTSLSGSWWIFCQ
jgi:hypothetical protein